MGSDSGVVHEAVSKLREHKARLSLLELVDLSRKCFDFQPIVWCQMQKKAFHGFVCYYSLVK